MSGRELLEPDRGGEAGRPGADDDHVELHRLAGGRSAAFMALQSTGRPAAVRGNRPMQVFLPLLHSRRAIAGRHAAPCLGLPAMPCPLTPNDSAARELLDLLPGGRRRRRLSARQPVDRFAAVRPRRRAETPRPRPSRAAPPVAEPVRPAGRASPCRAAARARRRRHGGARRRPRAARRSTSCAPCSTASTAAR